MILRSFNAFAIPAALVMPSARTAPAPLRRDDPRSGSPPSVAADALFRSHQHRHGDGHVLTLRSRFIPDAILDVFERRAHGGAAQALGSATGSPIRVDVAARMRAMWE
jgi:hypothetical protein